MVNRSIVLVQPAALTYNVSLSSNESCLGACDGTIVVDSLAGGVAPYAALLTDNITALLSSHTMSAANTILGVCSGDYTIALTDVNACPSSVIPGGVSQQLVGYDAYTTADILGVEDTVCHAASTGELAVSVPNSNPSYTYSWQDLNGGVVSTAATATNLAAGVYVLLADYNNTDGCTASDTIEIIELAEIQNAVTIEHVACYGESTGSILASASGTVPTYSYAWSSGQTTVLASNLSAGPYALTIEDGNGCERDFTYTVTEPLGLDLIVTQNSFTLTALVSLGTSPYTYEWFKQGVPSQVLSTNVSYTVSSNGTYYVVVTDANICVLTSDMIVYGSVGVVEAGLLDLSIYPNPFKQETTVDFGREIKQATIRVVDVFGKMIEEHTITNTNKHTLKRNNKAVGVYFVEIEVEQQEKAIFKLIVE